MGEVTTATYRDRIAAGTKLAERLTQLGIGRPIVVGIAPGGVPIAYEVARVLGAPLESWHPREGGHAPRTSMRNQTVVLVDDGVATGATMRAAVRDIRQEKPHRIVVAAPVILAGAAAQLDPFVDGVVWLSECASVEGIRGAYEQFDLEGDDDAASLVDRRHHELTSWPPPPPTRR